MKHESCTLSSIKIKILPYVRDENFFLSEKFFRRRQVPSGEEIVGLCNEALQSGIQQESG